MDKTRKISLKEILLLCFVFISVVLVGVQWAQGIIGQEDQTPDFVRPTAAFQVDEDYYQNWNQLEVTPTHRHRNTQEVIPTATP